MSGRRNRNLSLLKQGCITLLKQKCAGCVQDSPIVLACYCYYYSHCTNVSSFVWQFNNNNNNNKTCGEPKCYLQCTKLIMQKITIDITNNKWKLIISWRAQSSTTFLLKGHAHELNVDLNHLQNDASSSKQQLFAALPHD